MKSALLAVSLWLLSVAAILACDTPVYRYAMYRWRPSPYEVYFFHRDEIPEADRKLQDALAAASEAEIGPANLFVQPVNLAKDPELKSIPIDVRKTWSKRDDRPVPSYLVVTPQGDEIFSGPLDATELPAFLESPLRKQLGAALESGNACVLLLLSGLKKNDEGKLIEDTEATDKAEREVHSLVADIKGGKVDLEEQRFERKVSETPSDKPKHGIAYLRVSRLSEPERWLVKSLLSVERDLPELQEPMVFGVFGRGRALPPFVGKGITRDGLLDCVYFVSGACSCTVKEQNPGLDLLAKYDWEAAAAKVAEKFGAEEGNEHFTAGDVFGQLAIPAKTKSVETNNEPSDPTTEANPSEAKTNDDTDKTSEPAEPTKSRLRTNPGDKKAQAGVKSDAKSAPPAWGESLWIMGSGIGIAFVLLFAATFVVLRPR